MKARWLFAIVCSIQVLGIGGIMFLQGCATRGDAHNKRIKVAKPSVAVKRTEVLKSQSVNKPTRSNLRGVIMPPKPNSSADVGAGVQPAVKEFVMPKPVDAAPPRMSGLKKASSSASHVNIIGKTSGAVGSAADIVSSPPSETQTYTIQRGDSLSKIAYRYKVSTSQLAELNNISNPNSIKIGQVISLPGEAILRSGSSPKSSSAKPVAKKSSFNAKATGGSYTVKAGDSLSKIAVANGVKTSALKSANNLTSDRILVGQKLAIPGAASVKRSSTPVVENLKIEPVTPVLKVETDSTKSSSLDAAAEKAESVSITRTEVKAPVVEPSAEIEETAPVFDATFPYTVQDGETLESIAKAFIVSKEAILKANKLSGENGVVPGAVLKIPPSEF